MLTDPLSNSLIRITPVAERGTGTVLSLRWQLLQNALLMMTPAATFVVSAAVFALANWFGTSHSFLITGLVVASAISAQVLWAGTYPEWPMNLLLVRRLRESCRNRTTNDQGQWLDSARMVEWVPRENWGATQLETAEDVMLMRISPAGVQMEGDRRRYWFPASSIIEVETESVRPVGCFHSLHFVILTVRVDGGPMEIPLAYRDHTLGSLRSRLRWRDTTELCQRIRSVATGGDWTWQSSSRRDPPHQRPAGPTSTGLNPYAAPRMIQ